MKPAVKFVECDSPKYKLLGPTPLELKRRWYVRAFFRNNMWNKSVWRLIWCSPRWPFPSSCADHLPYSTGNLDKQLQWLSSWLSHLIWRSASSNINNWFSGCPQRSSCTCLEKRDVDDSWSQCNVWKLIFRSAPLTSCRRQQQVRLTALCTPLLFVAN